MLTFLVIDDDPNMTALIQTILERGFGDIEIIIAFDGEVGLDIALEYKPDLIICDVVMPFMNGHDLLKHLHQIPEMRSIPFLLQAPMSEECVAWLQYEFGLDIEKHFIQCPATIRDWLAKVRLLLEESRHKKLHTYRRR